MPKRYLVRPNQEVIDAHKTADVRISLQTREAKQLRNETMDMQAEGKQIESKDKFLIQTVTLGEEYRALVEDARGVEDSSKLMAEVLGKMWKAKTKEEFKSHKLRCEFIYTDTGVRDSIVMNEVEAKLGTEKPGSGSGVHGLGSSGGMTTEDDIATLRRKYNELVNFTVQLTSERDRIKDSYKAAAKELAMLKQQRHEGGGIGGALDRGSRTTGTATALRSSAGGNFTLFHLVLVAVLAFLLAKVLE